MERDLNKRICAALAGLDPCRVENPACPGTPDINYEGGWIESKQIGMPVDPDTVVLLHHDSPQQRSWHVRRRKVGGRVHVVIEDSRHGDVYVLEGVAAASHLGVDWTRYTMERAADLHMDRWNGTTFRHFVNACDSARHG